MSALSRERQGIVGAIYLERDPERGLGVEDSRGW